MSESTTQSTDAEERFWTWLRSNMTLSERLLEALGDLSEFSVLRYIEAKHIDEGDRLESLVIKVTSREAADAEIASRQLPASIFPDKYQFTERLPAADHPVIVIGPW